MGKFTRADVLDSLSANARLIRKAGAERVGDDTATELGNELLIIGSMVAEKAVELAREKGRKGVKAEDVKAGMVAVRPPDRDLLLKLLGFDRKLECTRCGQKGSGPYVYQVRKKDKVTGKAYEYKYLFMKHPKGKLCSLGSARLILNHS